MIGHIGEAIGEDNIVPDTGSFANLYTLPLPVNCVLIGQQPEPGKMDANSNPLSLKLIFGE